MKKITVLGSGGWGTALALVSDICSHKTYVWGKFQNEIDTINSTRENPLLKGVEIPKSVEFTTDIDCVCKSDIVIIATPSFAVRETARLIRDKVGSDTVIVSVAKGFEKDTLLTFSQVIKSELPSNPVVVLSGPSHAEEVARKIPTSIVAASSDGQACVKVQQLLSNDFFRIYTNPDIVGVEVGAALKNVIAVAAGIILGLNLGDNSTAALITRGMAEMSRLGVSLGAEASTFAGLSGIGDLVVTCTSKHSRNRSFGVKIGQGCKVDDALEQIGTVEGYFATATAKSLAEKQGVEMPIVNECYKILYENSSPKDSVKNLMNREKKAETF